MSHRHSIKVRGYHCDFYGHVNNARYLEFLEEARWSFLEETLDLAELVRQGLGFIVADINIRYRRPAAPGTVLDIDSAMVSLGRKRGVIGQRVYSRQGQVLVAEAEVTFVVAALDTGKPVVVDGPLRDALTPAAEEEA